MLSSEQINHFHEQGYLVVENAFSLKEIASLKLAALDIVADFDIEKNRTVFRGQGCRSG